MGLGGQAVPASEEVASFTFWKDFLLEAIYIGK